MRLLPPELIGSQWIVNACGCGHQLKVHHAVEPVGKEFIAVGSIEVGGPGTL
jgi:hypothetical protein